jgi:S-phase kinase-associated protein 1
MSATVDKKEDKKEGEVGGLSLDDVTGTLKLVSKDKKDYEIERKHAFVSTLVKTSLDTDATATEVPIPGVASAILAEVITYMNHHKGVEPPIVEKPLRSKVMKDVCKDPFDADFIDRIGENRQALYDLILAANYMDIKSLLHLGCAKVASLIKGQPLEKIKDILSTGAKTDDKKEEKKADEAPAKKA